MANVDWKKELKDALKIMGKIAIGMLLLLVLGYGLLVGICGTLKR